MSFPSRWAALTPLITFNLSVAHAIREKKAKPIDYRKEPYASPRD